MLNWTHLSTEIKTCTLGPIRWCFYRGCICYEFGFHSVEIDINEFTDWGWCRDVGRAGQPIPVCHEKPLQAASAWLETKLIRLADVLPIDGFESKHTTVRLNTLEQARPLDSFGKLTGWLVEFDWLRLFACVRDGQVYVYAHNSDDRGEILEPEAFSVQGLHTALVPELALEEVVLALKQSVDAYMWIGE